MTPTPQGSAERAFLAGSYRYRVVRVIGRNVWKEAPGAINARVLALLPGQHARRIPGGVTVPGRTYVLTTPTAPRRCASGKASAQRVAAGCHQDKRIVSFQRPPVVRPGTHLRLEPDAHPDPAAMPLAVLVDTCRPLR